MIVRRNSPDHVSTSHLESLRSSLAVRHYDRSVFQHDREVGVTVPVHWIGLSGLERHLPDADAAVLHEEPLRRRYVLHCVASVSITFVSSIR
jgi:hypothetical protein